MTTDDVEKTLGDVKICADALVCLFAHHAGGKPEDLTVTQAAKPPHELPAHVSQLFAKLAGYAERMTADQYGILTHLTQQLDDCYRGMIPFAHKFPRKVQVAHMLLGGCLPKLAQDLEYIPHQMR